MGVCGGGLFGYLLLCSNSFRGSYLLRSAQISYVGSLFNFLYGQLGESKSCKELL